MPPLLEDDLEGSDFPGVAPASDFRDQILDMDETALPDDLDASKHGGDVSATLGRSLQVELDAIGDDDQSEVFDVTTESLPVGAKQPHRYTDMVVELPRSGLIHPRSIFEGYEPPLPVAKERVAVSELLKFDESQLQDDFAEFELDQFSIYVNRKIMPFELRPLHHLNTKIGHSEFLFDGILSIGDLRFYVQERPFDEVPLGNYGVQNPTVGDQIWIRSRYNKDREIYYRLKNPAIEYARFHKPFLWVADLAKHFVDYCEAMTEKGRNVTILDFRSNFSQWLKKAHKNSPSFRAWLKAYGRDDFRTAIVANQEFIYKEHFAVGTKKLQIWSEIRTFSRYKTIDRHDAKEVSPTIVTPYIYECFSHMQVGQILQSVVPTVDSSEAVESSWPKHPHTGLSFTCRARKGQSRADMIAKIRPGDTISTPPDPAHTGTKWNSEGDRWFGLIQKVYYLKNNSRCFDVTWLYRPAETPCCSMRYPYGNELFLSDHCTCKEGRDSKVHDNEILDVHTVEWLGSPDTTAEFFVRQTYTTEERRFVTLQKSHLTCDHEHKETPYRVGDTILAATSPGELEVLEPSIIVDVYREGSKEYARLRKLLRRRKVDPSGPKCPPNELVFTDQYTNVRMAKIEGRCLVRAFRPNDKIPTPYDRNGTGNVFFITHQEVLEDGEPRYVPLKTTTTLPRQGFDPSRRCKKLRAMDLFCGCGNFGRGLEEGGAIQCRWANDIWDRAIHTYMANAKSPCSVHPFLGSVDDMLHRGLQGRFSDSVPQPGEVDLISGGSPCPGFSLLTSDKATLPQLKNRSLVASFASFIDFYRPKYGILENVPSIVQSKANRKEDFFSQLICAIIGMGYQAQIIQGDAWSHGAPQQRVRAFLYFAAPGLPLPTAPPISHSHPPKTNLAGLGLMTNGEPYVRREVVPTAFKYVSAREATGDLPDIMEGKVDTCVPCPDHRLGLHITTANIISESTARERKNGFSQILNIPVYPYGMNFAKAWNRGHGIMPPEDRDAYPDSGKSRVQHNSNAWGRISPYQVFATITTMCSHTDARVGGRQMHWNQPRPITLMEVRRAQGIPDDEVLVGDTMSQWRMVGNSVARQIALALGLKFREAWLGTLYDEEPASTAISEVLASTTHAIEVGEDATLIAVEDDEDPLASETQAPAVRGEQALLPIYFSEDDNGASSSKASELRISPDSTAGDRTDSTPATSIPDSAGATVGPALLSARKRHLSRFLGSGLTKKARLGLDEGDKSLMTSKDDTDRHATPKELTVVRLDLFDEDDDVDICSF
ncbi:DNA (Cytosine-5)-methyltransferase 1 [Pleurostoma richardsiae]|uniref:DNA (cytosine-5-)-methyltransferase n=1 Tax=Pleurostoma richardsiae TaxID=41990 RepID=A0AA38RUZ2_9PEZI|nr:DNA (Cytosine-5)-methyltransferase 1 [Pleurostoma richardsiae]